VINDPLVRSTDPATSHEAAARIKVNEGTCLERVLQAIQYAPNGATCDNACIFTGLRWNNVSRRLTTLRRAGLIYADGKRNGQTVYRAVR
jgi:DNA-binding transcriptional ArsR family regulator